MSEWDMPQIIEIVDKTKCVRLEDFLKIAGYKELYEVAKGKIEQLRSERDEAVKSELAAIEAWDEERKRAIREGERVIEEREKYLAMRGLNNNATELAEKYKRERDQWRIQCERAEMALQNIATGTSCRECGGEDQARLAKDVIKTASDL